ncbi:hypothetical protein [Flindersiella endophytica]
MRTEAEVSRELADVRARREELFPVQTEPLGPQSPQPAGFYAGAPGGEITELLEREALLVLELAEIRRAQGTRPESAVEDEVASAQNVLARIADARRADPDV